VAKQLASLAGLAPRRVLPVFGLRPARANERSLFPAPAGRRAALFDESLRLVRLLLDEEVVTFEGEFFAVDSVSIGPKVARSLDIWLGGTAPAALRRVGHFADGWLASFVSPDDARRGREAIKAAAAEAGREIEADHFGVSLAVAPEGITAELAAVARERRPESDPADFVAGSWPDAHRLINRYLDAGITKFVIRPAGTVAPFTAFLERFIDELVPLEN
jgi:probable F420-dependent oxidoreductase